MAPNLGSTTRDDFSNLKTRKSKSQVTGDFQPLLAFAKLYGLKCRRRAKVLGSGDNDANEVLFKHPPHLLLQSVDPDFQ